MELNSDGIGLYLGDGDWLSWDQFGDIDPDVPCESHLARLEWEAEVRRRFPHADTNDVRQLIRLIRAVEEEKTATGRDLDVFGVIGERYAAVAWGLRLNRNPKAPGSDGRIGCDHVEVKTITPGSSTLRVEVKLSGNFNKLLVVRAAWGTGPRAMLGLTSRMVARADLTKMTRGKARFAWSNVEAAGCAPEATWPMQRLWA